MPCLIQRHQQLKAELPVCYDQATNIDIQESGGRCCCIVLRQPRLAILRPVEFGKRHAAPQSWPQAWPAYRHGQRALTLDQPSALWEAGLDDNYTLLPPEAKDWIPSHKTYRNGLCDV